jgi:hypothetical protein
MLWVHLREATMASQLESDCIPSLYQVVVIQGYKAPSKLNFLIM